MLLRRSLGRSHQMRGRPVQTAATGQHDDPYYSPGPWVTHSLHHVSGRRPVTLTLCHRADWGACVEGLVKTVAHFVHHSCEVAWRCWRGGCVLREVQNSAGPRGPIICPSFIGAAKEEGRVTCHLFSDPGGPFSI